MRHDFFLIFGVKRMSCALKRLADFGSFTFDFSQHVLLRGDKPVDLSPRAAAVLEYLTENPGRWVSKEELRNQFWPKVHVTDNNIDQKVAEIRRALGDSPRRPRFVETKHKRGCRFIAPIAERAEVARAASASISAAPPPDTVSVPDAPDAVPCSPDTIAPTVPSNSPVGGNDRYRRIALLLIVAGIAGAIFTLYLMPKREARVVDCVQLTNDGKPKFGPLLIDGQRIFFVEMMGASRQIASIPVSGGDAALLDIPLSGIELQDISHDGSTLLLHGRGTGGTQLWTYSIHSGSLRPLRARLAYGGAWSPDGERLATYNEEGLSFQISGGLTSNPTKLPRRVYGLKWAPDGKRLRFSMLDTKQESSSEWEVAERNGHPRRLGSISDGQRYVSGGAWSRNGKYFFYEAGTYWHQDIWMLPESAGLLPFIARRPSRLTNAPGSWQWPTPTLEKSTIFAINNSVRSELVRFDRRSSSWQPKWSGAPAYELDYSRDLEWVTYTYLLDHTIWKARPDGSGRVRLTNAGLEAHQPHWSPDGTHIGFMAKNAKGQWRIFQVAAEGGAPEELLPSGEDQGVPTWSLDGRFVIFGDLIGRRPRAEMSIHLLDLSTRKVHDLTESKGLWSPRWSPDGRYIAAVTSDSQAIRVLPSQEGRWSELVRMSFVDNITWSANSRYIYFNGSDDTGHHRFFRLTVPEGRLESLADLAGFIWAPENWYGVAPDGTPLAFRGIPAHEIYALKYVLP